MDSQIDAMFMQRLAFNLRFVWPPNYVSLRGLAMTWKDLHWLWSMKSNSIKFFTVWPRNASRHKLIASQLYTREIYDFCNLRELASRLANPFGHPSQVLVLQTCIDLHRLASPFGFSLHLSLRVIPTCICIWLFVCLHSYSYVCKLILQHLHQHVFLLFLSCKTKALLTLGPEFLPKNLRWAVSGSLCPSERQTENWPAEGKKEHLVKKTTGLKESFPFQTCYWFWR